MVTNDLWEFVINGFNDLIDPTQYVSFRKLQKTQLEESRRRDAKALSLIEAAIIETIIPWIVTKNYAKEAWDIVEMNFKEIDKVRVVKL